MKTINLRIRLTPPLSNIANCNNILLAKRSNIWKDRILEYGMDVHQGGVLYKEHSVQSH